MLKSWSLI